MTRAALERALAVTQEQPSAIWSDNGTEFKAEFDALLIELRIQHIRTDPYTPEQNGKMERFWPTLEERPADVPLLEWIERYNNIEQLGLPRNPEITDTMVSLTPNKAYVNSTNWPENGNPRVPFRASSMQPSRSPQVHPLVSKERPENANPRVRSDQIVPSP
jgi:hypothetical protein